MDSEFDADFEAADPATVIEEMTNNLPGLKERYKVERILKAGFFGEVFLASALYDTGNADSYFAIKYIDWADSENVLNEVKILKELKGVPNIIEIVEHYQLRNLAAIITKFFDSIDLETSYRVFSPAQIQTVFRSILNGLKGMHSRGIVHGDLKPSNILFNADLTQFRLIDMGLAFKVGEPLKDCATIGYTALESLLKCDMSSCVYDIWNVGVIMLGMLSGVTPFFLSDGLEELKEFAVVFGTDAVKTATENLEKTEEAEKALKDFEPRPALNLRKLCITWRHKHLINEPQSVEKCFDCYQFKTWCICKKSTEPDEALLAKDRFPAETYDLLRKLLTLDFNQRPTAEQALAHDFFKLENLGTERYLAEDHPDYKMGFVRLLHPKYAAMIARYSDEI